MSHSEIVRQIDLAAPIDRVWEALTDYRQFGAWFNVAMETPFAEGQIALGQFTIDGYTHVRFEAKVVRLVPQRDFAWTWHPYAVDPAVDYSAEPPTLVEFSLTPSLRGTLLVVRESGFDRLPRHRLAEALQKNGDGWTWQLENIADYVSQPRT